VSFAACLVTPGAVIAQEAAPYLVVDLSGGLAAQKYPVSELAAVPEGGWTEEHMTRKLVLRHVPAGSFVMGSPAKELGRPSHRHDEDQHRVTITKDFYIGVFEVTQEQWFRVVGTRPGYFRDLNTRDSRPVESVSYSTIRRSRHGPLAGEDRAGFRSPNRSPVGVCLPGRHHECPELRQGTEQR
jgi:hypothetical protein